MQITSLSIHDPVGDFPFLNAYMRWALIAAEEVAGKQGLHIVLRQNGLERLVDNYPPEDFTISAGITNRDYTALCTGLLELFGRAGRGALIRMGRRSAMLAFAKQSEGLGLNVLLSAARLLPDSFKFKAGLEFNVNAFKKIYKEGGADWIARIEDRGDKWAYIVETCGLCVEKQSDSPICTVFIGTLAEGVFWLLGKEHDVREVECHAMGAPACVWEISKAPKE